MKTGPFDNPTCLDLLNTRLVWYSDGYCAHFFKEFENLFRSVKKPSYDCFLEKCNLRFWNADDRKQHSINEHSFPADFKFDTRDKNGGNGSKKKNGKSLFKKNNPTEEKMDDTPILEKVDSKVLKNSQKSR